MHKSGLITVLMLTGLALGVMLGAVIHEDLAAAINNAGFIMKPVLRVLLWIQSALGLEPVARTSQFNFEWLRELGTLIVIRPLMLMTIPLVFISVVTGVTAIADPAKLGLVGGATLLYYVITMLLAAVLAVASVSVFRPGDLPAPQRQSLTARAEETYVESDAAVKISHAKNDNKSDLGGAWSDLVEQLVPTNVVHEAAEGRTLGVIAFALLLGLSLAAGGKATQPAIAVFAALFDAIMRLVGWIIWLLPVGVLLLVAHTVGKIGLGAIAGPMGKFMLLVMAGLAVHALIVLPIVLAITARVNPYRFIWDCRKALLTAFGTSSSSATLPVTIQVCETEAGCSKRATNFVIPLGATVNMNGTALFEAVAVVFLCQLYGINLDFTELVIIVITATLAAIGAAGIPAAGLVSMVIVINAVNLSLESRGLARLPESAIGVIIGIDRILDMCRTTVNVWGDMVGAKIMTQLAPDPVVESTTAAA